MAQKFNDSLTSFFQDPDNFRRLSFSQYRELVDLQLQIDTLNDQNLSDFELTNRDTQVQHLRDKMVALVDKALENEKPAVDPIEDESVPPGEPRHMRANKDQE